MRKLDLEERKKISLKILEDIKSICERHNITFFLGYGTLLGAIRHNGFIPWDDDIDIWVPISSYEKLMFYLENESRYELINHLINEQWPSSFSKLSNPFTIIMDGENVTNVRRGVAVDIFPLFECKKSNLWVKRVCRSDVWISRIFNYNHGYYNKTIKDECKKILIKVTLILGKDICYWRKKLINLEKKNLNTRLVGTPISPYGIKDIHSKECFEDIELKDFEGEKYYV